MASSMKEFLAFLALTIGLASFAPYYLAMWRGTVRPHLFSWIPWTLTTAVGFWASLSYGGGYGSWILALQAICCGSVLVYAIFRGETHFTFLDRAALIGSILSVVFYVFTKNAIVSILLAATADCLGYIPTFRKSITKPHEEPVSTYALSGVGFALSIGALSSYNFQTVFYPLVLVIANFAFVFYATHRKGMLRK